MKTDKANKNSISTPLLDNLISNRQLHPDLFSEIEKDSLLQIVNKLKGVAICDDDDRRELWFTARRGPIEDFGNYDEYLENEEVENKEDFEKIWKDYYPDEVKWYLFSVRYYNGEYFIGIDNKLTFHVKTEKAKINDSSAAPLIYWISLEVDKCIDWLKKDTAGYNRYFNQHLPYTKRTGRIFRGNYWKIVPDEKEWMLKGLSDADIKVLKTIAELSEDEERIGFLDNMTSGMFFNCCKMGYDANKYPYTSDLKPVDLYRMFADGRDGGLTKLDSDSPHAFEEWFGKREYQIGHPWEVCRGGNSTHISLYVHRYEKGWRFSLAGKSCVRVAETVRFAIALYNHKIPFKLRDAKEIPVMVTGTDHIGIVPENVTPVYCYSYFPPEDNINDFMNLPFDNRDKIIATAQWYPLKEIKLAEG